MSGSNVRHLEQRIASQRHDLTIVQNGNRVNNVRMRAWYEGREALLKEQLRELRAENERLRGQR